MADTQFRLDAQRSWSRLVVTGFMMTGMCHADYLVGGAKIDQTSQGVRTKGKYDTNYIVFFGGTARCQF